MPVTTPSIKSDAVKRLGAKVRLVGDNFDETAQQAHKFCTDHNLLFIPPYDDPDVIAGQGTCGLEIAEDAARFGVDTADVLVCCGGSWDDSRWRVAC